MKQKDKSKIYAAYNGHSPRKGQAPAGKFKRIKILYEDAISYYVASLTCKDSKGHPVHYSVKKHCFVLQEIKPKKEEFTLSYDYSALEARVLALESKGKLRYDMVDDYDALIAWARRVLTAKTKEAHDKAITGQKEEIDRLLAEDANLRNNIQALREEVRELKERKVRHLDDMLKVRVQLDYEQAENRKLKTKYNTSNKALEMIKHFIDNGLANMGWVKTFITSTLKELENEND